MNSRPKKWKLKMPRRKTWRNCLRARNELLGVFILICVDRVTKISCINAHASTLSNVSLLSHLDKCALQCSATSGNNVFPFRHPLVRCGQFSLIRRNISSDICNKYLLQAQNVVTAGELVEIQLSFDKYQYWNQAELDFRILCCRSHSISEFKNRLIHLIDSKYFLFALIWWIPVRLYLYFENARLPDPGSCQKIWKTIIMYLCPWPLSGMETSLMRSKFNQWKQKNRENEAEPREVIMIEAS